MRFLRRLLASAVLATLALGQAYGQSPLKVVAAENFYGDIARQIGGKAVDVTSILSNPDQDPHLFEVSPSVARSVSGARIVVLNGIGYDPWMEKILRAAPNPDRKAIVVADLTDHKAGDNPHIWYDPGTAPALAKALAEAFSAADPAHKPDFESNLNAFEQSLQPIKAKIAGLRARWAGTLVTATEPVFGYMFAALGMTERNTAFQLAVMNDTEPSASAVAGFENDLKTRKVRLLAYNSQASGAIADRMRELARASGIPVIAVTETEPAGKSFQAWLMDDLDALDKALAN